MLRNSISYIFRLGKRESLPFRPLQQLRATREVTPAPLSSQAEVQGIPREAASAWGLKRQGKKSDSPSH